jgi:hypothetical protein
MLNTVIDTFINLDESNKNKLLNILSKIINPIKLDLIVVIFFLLIMCVSNYFIYYNLGKLIISVNNDISSLKVT